MQAVEQATEQDGRKRTGNLGSWRPGTSGNPAGRESAAARLARRDAIAVAFDDTRRETGDTGQGGPVGRGGGGQRHQGLGAQHLERRPVLRPGPGLSLGMERPKDRQPAPIEPGGAAEPPVPVLVGGPHGHRECGQHLALLDEPRLAPERPQLGGQAVAQRDQMPDVLDRVLLLGGRQGAACPVRLLLRLDRMHADVLLEQPIEPELAHPEEPGREARVEDRGEREPVSPLELAEVVVGAVEDLDDTRLGAQRPERLEVGQGQGVHEVGPAVGIGQLNQAEALGIVVEAVRLGVDGDGPGAAEVTGEVVQVGGGSNPDRGRGHASRIPVPLTGRPRGPHSR